MHHYYYDPERYDLSKMRQDASDRLHGNGVYRGGHEESTIHHHAKYINDPAFLVKAAAVVPCEGHDHEEFKQPKDVSWLVTS